MAAPPGIPHPEETASPGIASPEETAPPASPRPGVTVLPGAASVSVRDLLTAPARPVSVLADFGRVAYLDVDGDLLALSGPGAVRLPFALVLTGALPALSGEVLVGEGALRTRSAVVEVRRWWRPPTPRGLAAGPYLRAAPSPAADPHPPADHDGGGPSRLAKALDRHDRRGEEERRTTRDVAERAAALEAALRAALEAEFVAAPRVEGMAQPHPDAAVRAAVEALVGRGPGLTPAGDDVLAGALLAGHGTPVATALAAALPADLTSRTTLLAAALVRAASRGEGTPEGVALVDAVRGHREVEPALERLLALGHSSGADTALGILVGARAVAARAARSEEDE